MTIVVIALCCISGRINVHGSSPPRSLFKIANPIPLESVVGRLVRTTHWITLLFILISLSLLKPLWCDGDVLAFRDSCHFYYPLWQYVSKLPTSQQLLPMWNPGDAFGCSIIGEPTSMVFYPLRVILLVPISSLENRIGWFFIAHLLIGYFGWLHAGNRVLRVLGNNMPASKVVICLTGAAYVLSGPVFFQIYNPPFLAGACWLPIAMGDIVCRWSRRQSDYESSLPSIALLGSLCMMFLAGDVQMVYHLFMIAGLAIPCKILFDIVVSSDCFREAVYSRELLQSLRRQLVWHLSMVALLLSVTAIQSIPTYYWYQISERSVTQSNSTNLHGVDPTNDYSIAWWEYLSLAQPDVFGSVVPTHTRWAQALDPQRRVWIPSLHVGIVALVGVIVIIPSMITRLTSRRHAIGDRHTTDSVFSVCLLVLGTLAISWASSLEGSWLDFFWRTQLPLYSGFRYTAKWSVFVAWSLSLLALLGWNRWLFDSHSKLPIIVCVAALTCSSLGFICHALIASTQATSDAWRVYFYRILDDPLCGPFNYELALRLFGWSSATNVVIITMVIIVLWKAQSNRIAIGLLSLTSIIQLSYSANNQISTVPSTIFAVALDKPLDPTIQRVRSTWSDPSQSIILPTSNNQGSLPVLNESPTPVDLVLRQIQKRIGKLHLLYNERSFVADFSLRPRTVDARMNEHPLDYWQAFSRDDSPEGLAELFADISVKPHEISMEVLDRKQQSIVIPVLQDGGWTVKSGSAEIDPNLAGDRIRINIKPDAQRIELVYLTPGLVAGCVISLIGMSVYGGFVYMRIVTDNHESKDVTLACA